MTTKRRREQAAFPIAGTRIRGRLRGLETVWTLDRFAEVIRSEVSRGIERAWPPDRIRSWINTAYELDQRSMPHATKAIDSVLGMLGLVALESDTDDEPPRRAQASAARARGGTAAKAARSVQAR